MERVKIGPCPERGKLRAEGCWDSDPRCIYCGEIYELDGDLAISSTRVVSGTQHPDRGEVTIRFYEKGSHRLHRRGWEIISPTTGYHLHVWPCLEPLIAFHAAPFGRIVEGNA